MRPTLVHCHLLYLNKLQLWLEHSVKFPFGEGNGNPLQCSCLENPRDGGVWWAAIYGVAQSWTRLKRLSSSSSKLILPSLASGPWHHLCYTVHCWQFFTPWLLCPLTFALLQGRVTILFTFEAPRPSMQHLILRVSINVSRIKLSGTLKYGKAHWVYKTYVILNKWINGKAVW